MLKKGLSKLAQALRARSITRRHLVLSLVICAVLLLSCLTLLRLSPYYPSIAGSQYFRARVLSVQTITAGSAGSERLAEVRLLDGPNHAKLAQVLAPVSFGDAAAKRLPIGSEVLLNRQAGKDAPYTFVSRWYVPGIATLCIILLVLVIVIGAWRGITSVFGLAISIGILSIYIVPSIIAGHNALTVCIIGAVLITFISLYVAHGLSKRTTVAFLASLATLFAAVLLTLLASYLTGTSEVIDESSVGLLYAAHPLDIGGLLTGGVIIASLGALFDVTTGQAATVDELYKVDHKLTAGKLYWKSMSVGREHIAALINTLGLVYVGAALPTIVTTIVLNQEAGYHAPFIVNMNTETIAEEVMRTAVASIAMLLALPITTWLAVYLLPKWERSKHLKG